MGLLIAPAALVVLALLAAPTLILLRISLNSFSPTELMQEAFTADNYVRAFTDPYYQQTLLTTVMVAFACTLISLALAFPAAYRLARMESRWKSAATILTLFPLLVGNVVRSAGWMALIGNEGFINAMLRGLGITSAPVQMMYTVGAVIAGTVAVVLPFMVLTLSAVIESIPRAVEEAAANLGASPATVFRRVLWPLAMPGVMGGAVLVFILCMNAYATPVLLGGPKFKMMAPAVYEQFVVSSNWPFGAALAFMLLAATVVLTALTSVGLARRYGTRAS